MTGAPEALLHASCVAINGGGVLLMGASGSGKSAMALELMAMGALLVADDVTRVALAGGALVASCPSEIAGLIEARGVGILRAPHQAEARLVLAVDLDRREAERLPPRRSITLLGQPLDLLFPTAGRHFPAALRCYVTSGRQD